MKITGEHIDHWQRHGYVLVERFLDPEDLAAAQAELAAFFPSPGAVEADPESYSAIEAREFPEATVGARVPAAGSSLLERGHARRRGGALPRDGHDAV